MTQTTSAGGLRERCGGEAEGASLGRGQPDLTAGLHAIITGKQQIGRSWERYLPLSAPTCWGFLQKIPQWMQSSPPGQSYAEAAADAQQWVWKIHQPHHFRGAQVRIRSYQHLWWLHWSCSSPIHYSDCLQHQVLVRIFLLLRWIRQK